MKTHSSQQLLKFGLFIVIFLALAISVAGPDLVRAGTELPPRNPPPSPGQPPAPPSDDDDDDGDPLTALIVLQASGSAGGWAGVQWEDSNGDWHDVNGWQGTIGANGSQIWVVEAKDFGTGLFRWVVRSGSGGSIIGTSQSFTLPNGAGQTVRVSVSL